MPLTKLARRYHSQRRPKQQEQGLETPSSCSQIRKVLDFETPEIPPYVTVRKKKPLPKCDFMGDTLHTTVIESANFPISDCQGWKRLESTHIDHVAEAFGHMTLLTNDISAIHTVHNVADDSFKTALEVQEDNEPELIQHIVLAEDAEANSIQINEDSSNRDLIAESPSDAASLAKVAQWVLSSPFQSPRQTPLKLDTIVISESDPDSSIDNYDNGKNDTSNIARKNTNAKKVLPKHRQNILVNRVSLSSSNNTDSEKSLINPRKNRDKLAQNQYDTPRSSGDGNFPASHNSIAKNVLTKQTRRNIFGNRVSLSSSNNTDNDKSNNASKNKNRLAKNHSPVPSKSISAKKILSDHRQNILGNRLSLSDNDESNNAWKSKETPTDKNGSHKPGTSTNAKKVLSEFRQGSSAKNYNSTPDSAIKNKSVRPTDKNGSPKPGTSTNAKKVLSEFRQDSNAKNYNSTPDTAIRNKSVRPILPEKKKNIFGHRVSLSSSNNTDNDRSYNTSRNRNTPIWKDFITPDANQNKENNQSITDLWRLEESVHDDLTEVNKETEPNIDIVTLDSPSILVSSRSRSVSQQVSLSSLSGTSGSDTSGSVISATDENEREEEIHTVKQYLPKSSLLSKSVKLQASFSSGDESSFGNYQEAKSRAEQRLAKDLQDSLALSKSISLQVSLCSDANVSAIDEDLIKPTSKKVGSQRILSSEENSPVILAANTLSDVLDEDRNSQGNILFLNDTDETASKDKPLSFLTSLSLESPSDCCHPDALKYVKNFSKTKDELLQRLFLMFNKEAFDNQLPSDMLLLWNTRLTRSAGVCVQRKIRLNGQAIEERISKIELSSKVIDSADRLRDTLIHEMCHAAAWIKSGVRDGHGAFWKAWAEKAMVALPELPIIARCHSYVIRTKFTYVCEKCGQRIGRHSKSINVNKQICKLCGGQFRLLKNQRN